MKIEFAVSAGLHFREVEVVELSDDATDDEITQEYTNWVFEQVDGGWSKLDEVNDD